MGLKSITIENFKGIGAPVRIPLRPVTMLFGANSAGKSTVIQALQYAWEVLENRNADVDRTRLGGESIDLGGFRNLVHGRDLEKSIRITLEYEGPLRHEAYLPPDNFDSSLHPEGHVMDGDALDVTNWLDIRNCSITVTTGWDFATNGARITAYELGLNGVEFGRIEELSDTAAGITVNATHPCFSRDFLKDQPEHFRNILTAIHWNFSDMLECLRVQSADMPPGEERDEFLQRIEENIAQRGEEDPSASYSRTARRSVKSAIPEWGRPLVITTREEWETSEVFLSEEEYSVMSQLFLGAGEAVLEELRGLRYLGPLRAIPDRTFSAPLHPQRERWADGLGAWDALLRSRPEDGLVERCSGYLSDTLGMGYTVSKVDRIQLDEDSEILSNLRLMARQEEYIDGKDLLLGVVAPLEKLPRVPVVQLREQKSELDVNPMDIGVGVSQTLPVVVGAVEPHCTVFAVEQPELHIHPAVQVNLADVFLRELLEEGKKPRIFLLETHSEHLVLRIMRRMRQTCDNELPPDFPPVTPDHVAVLYVEAVDDRTCIREMPLNERGELVKAWPGGFFEEGLRETL